MVRVLGVMLVLLIFTCRPASVSSLVNVVGQTKSLWATGAIGVKLVMETVQPKIGQGKSENDPSKDQVGKSYKT